MQENGILTEAVFGYTSVTLKSKWRYSNKFGVFIYQNIKPSLFMGFNRVDDLGFVTFKASKAKALFDFFYFRIHSAKVLSMDHIDSYRLNLESLESKDLIEFYDYCKRSNMKKMMLIYTLITEKK